MANTVEISGFVDLNEQELELYEGGCCLKITALVSAISSWLSGLGDDERWEDGFKLSCCSKLKSCCLK